MSAINSKYNVKIGNFGFTLARLTRAERHAYSREEAPSFVNKFSSGDPNYRDSTFFPHWIQLNWQNGFDQEFFEDGGKFFRSSGVDTTTSSKLTLERNFSSIGQLASGVEVTAQTSFRGTLSSALLSDTDLIHYYEFEGSSTDYKATSNGTDTSITYSNTNGKYDKYAEFNGTSSKISWASWGATPTNGTLMFWMKADALTGAANPICTDDNNGNNAIRLELDTTYIRWYVHNTSGGSPASQLLTSSPVTGNWYHIALTWDTGAGTMTGYLDGTQIGTTSSVSFPTNLADPVAGRGFDTTRWFDGRIDELAYFDRALTANEIATYVTNNNPMSYQATSDNIEIFGTSDGTVYSWDGALTVTELFNTRRQTWYETGADTDKIIGDTGGVETAQSQGFQIAASQKVKAVQVRLKKNTGTPGDITCRIETDNANVPSGTLADANATATITSFSTTSYAWITVEFSSSFTLTAATTYHLVLKTAAAANDNNYAWSVDGSSPSYTSGAMSVSTDGGSTWSAVTASDAYFRVLGNATSVNSLVVSDITATSKLYIGIGNPEGTVAGDARIYSYDGTTFVLVKTFTGTNEATIGAMQEFGSVTRTMYIGLGSKAKIYSSTDMSTFTLAKTITIPKNPGYILAMAEYNNKLYVGGGFPENLSGNSNQFGGFLYSYDEFSWLNVFPFDHTVITALETYDTLLFIGTIKKRLYVFNTASIDKLLDFPWDVTIRSMNKWDDKLVLTIAARSGASTTGNEGVYLFDRSGFHNAFSVSGKEWTSASVFNNNLIAGSKDGYVYQTSFSTYISSGTLQTSYDESSLPSIHKIRRSVTLMYEAMPTNCSILIEYKTDESDSSWTSLGTASTLASTEATFTFSSGVYSKKISYRVTLATTTPSNTPVLKKIIHKYVLSPDFKYLWKMKLLCADNLVWADGTEPAGYLNADVSANATSITLKSSDNATPTEGFPDPNGSTAYASIINPSTGAVDTFSYTGKTSTTLTGIPSSGTYAITSHSAGDQVKVLGADLHRVILDLKQTRQLYTFTDIDGLTFTVLFHSYQADVWSINQDDFTGGLENEVPITLLEA